MNEAGGGPGFDEMAIQRMTPDERKMSNKRENEIEKTKNEGIIDGHSGLREILSSSTSVRYGSDEERPQLEMTYDQLLELMRDKSTREAIYYYIEKGDGNRDSDAGQFFLKKLLKDTVEYLLK